FVGHHFFHHSPFRSLVAPFQKRIEGKGITFRFKGYRAIWLVLGSTFHAELVGHRLGGKPEIYALYLARHDDVEVFTVTVLVIHVLSLMGQKYVQIGTSSSGHITRVTRFLKANAAGKLFLR